MSPHCEMNNSMRVKGYGSSRAGADGLPSVLNPLPFFPMGTCFPTGSPNTAKRAQGLPTPGYNKSGQVSYCKHNF